MRAFMIIVTMASALAGPAGAAGGGGPAVALRDWGLLGSWSKACGDRSGGVGLTTYAARADGKVLLTYSFGADSNPNIYVVNGVRIISPTVVVMDETFERNGSPYEVTLIREGNRIRVLHSRNPETGQAYVAGGVVQSTSRDSNWENRC